MPFGLQNSLLEWRVDLESTIYQQRQLTTLLALCLGCSDEIDCLCLEIIFDTVAEIVQLEEQYITYLNNLWVPWMTSNTDSIFMRGPGSA